MGNFNRDRGSSRDRGGFSRGGDRRGSDRGRGGDSRPEMHKATCAECGVTCEVPFRPTGGKPVYCSSCFSNKEDSAPRRSNDRERSRPMFGSDRGERRMFEAVCDGCGKDCEVPFKPSEDKPVYCDECFGKNNDSRRGDSKRSENRSSAPDNSLNKQIEALNSKLDKIIQILAPKDTKENVIKLAPQGLKLAPKETKPAPKEIAKVAPKDIKKEKAVKVVKKEVKKVVKKPVAIKAKPLKKKAK